MAMLTGSSTAEIDAALEAELQYQALAPRGVAGRLLGGRLNVRARTRRAPPAPDGGNCTISAMCGATIECRSRSVRET
jgi:hypothetical protein